MKEGYDSLSRPYLEFMQSFSVKSQRERSDPYSDGGQVPEPEGSTNTGMLPSSQGKKSWLWEKTDRPALLYLEPSLLNPKTSRNFPEASD